MTEPFGLEIRFERLKVKQLVEENATLQSIDLAENDD